MTASRRPSIQRDRLVSRPHQHSRGMPLESAMVMILVAVFLAIFAFFLLVSRAKAEEPQNRRMCAPAEGARKALAAAGEEPILRGLASTGEMFEVWSAKEGVTWTATAMTPQGILCILGMGSNAETRQHSPEEPGARA